MIGETGSDRREGGSMDMHIDIDIRESDAHRSASRLIEDWI